MIEWVHPKVKERVKRDREQADTEVTEEPRLWRQLLETPERFLARIRQEARKVG